MNTEVEKKYLQNKSVRIHVIFLIFAVLLELFACNFRTFQSLFYCEKDISEYPVQLDNVQMLPNGDLLLDYDAAFISIIVGNEKINNIYIDVDVIGEGTDQNNACDVT